MAYQKLMSIILMMRSRLNQLLWNKELMLVLGGQAVLLVGGLATVKLLTNTMGAEAYGVLALGVSIAGAVVMLVYGPISQFVMRYYSICCERQELSSYFSLIIRIHVFLALMFLLVTLFIYPLVCRWWGDDWGVIVGLSVIFGIISGIAASLLAVQNAMRQRGIVAIHQSMDLLMRLSFALFFLMLLGVAGYVALLGYLIGSLLVVSLNAFYLRHREYKNFSIERNLNAEENLRGRLFSYTFPFSFFALFGIISQYADRWILQGISGAESVGIYVAIYQIATAIVSLVIGVITQFVVPIIFTQAGQMKTQEQRAKSSTMVNMTAAATFFCIAPLVVLAYVFAEPLVVALTSRAFIGYADILWLLVAGMGIFHIAQVYVLHGLNADCPKVYIFPKAVQAVSFAVFAYFWVGLMGVYGLSFAICASSLLYLAMVLMVNRKLSVYKGIPL